LDGSGLQPGQSLRTNACAAGNAFQQWDAHTKGRYGTVATLRNRGSGLCLSVANADLAVAEPLVVLEVCSQACKQLWSMTGNKSALERARPSHPNEGQGASSQPRHDLSYLNLPPPLPEYAAGVHDVSKPVRAGKLVCWIMTSPGNHAEKAVVINNTWGKDCDILLFMTTQHQAGLNTVRSTSCHTLSRRMTTCYPLSHLITSYHALPYSLISQVVLTLGEKEDRHFLWRKSIMAWSFLYTHVLSRADWFIRADDDTVMLMDNLRGYLSTLNPHEPHYLGRRLNVEGQDFYSGGATNILSHEALRRLGDGIRDRAREVLHMSDTFADDL
jgi:hypothetical protein